MDINLDSINTTNINKEENYLNFKIISPGNGDRFSENEKIYIKIKQTGKENIKKYSIYLNDKYIAATSNDRFNFRLSNIESLKKGKNILRIAGQGISGSRLEKVIVFNVE